MVVKVGSKRSEDVYEASEDGLAAFKEWLREISRQPPPLREPIQFWLNHSTEDELPDILNAIRKQEKTAAAEFHKIQERLNSERILGRLGQPDGSKWEGKVRNAILNEMALIHGHRAISSRNLVGEADAGSRAASSDEPRRRGVMWCWCWMVWEGFSAWAAAVAGVGGCVFDGCGGGDGWCGGGAG